MQQGKLRDDGKFGGWPQEGGITLTWQIGDSYHYRNSFGTTLNEKPDFKMDNSSGTAIYTDHFVKCFGLLGKEYGHKDAYIATYLGGHSSIVHEPIGNSIVSLQPATFINGDWSAQGTVFQTFFDK